MGLLIKKMRSIELQWNGEYCDLAPYREVLEESGMEQALAGIAAGNREGELNELVHDSVGGERYVRGWWRLEEW